MKKLIVILLVGIFVLSEFSLPAAAESVETPSSVQIINDLKIKNPNMQHPRIMADGNKFNTIKMQVESNALMKDWYIRIKTTGDGMLNMAVSRYPTLTNGADMVWLARTIKSRIETLSFLYRLSGEVKYAERAWAEMSAVASFPDWNHSHFLDAAEITAGFGIGYDWLFDYLSDAQRATIRNAIINYGLNQALVYYNNPTASGQWVGKASNWNVVCTSSMGIAALAILDEDEARSSDIIARGFKSVKPALAMFAPDGDWEEGYTYWQYTMKYFVEYMSALNTALGTSYGYENSDGIQNAGYVPMYMFGAKQHFNFHDSNDPPSAPGMFWLSSKFNRKEMTNFRVSQMNILNITPLVYDLLWYNPGFYDANAKADLDGYFRGTETVSFRSSWYDSASNYVGFHAGKNNVGHGHLDAGSFVLDSQGERFIRDLGADDYLLPNYLGNPQGLSYYRRRAEGHNLIVVNPDEKPDQMLNATPAITDFESQPEGGFAVADLTSAMPLGTLSAKRGVMLTDQRRRTVVQDEAVFKNGVDIWWFAHTTAAVTLSADKKSAILTIGNKRLWVGITSNTGGVFTIMDASPLPTSPNPTQNTNSGIRKLAIHLTDVTRLDLTVEFAPLSGSETQPSYIMPVTKLDNWQMDSENTPELTRLTVDDIPIPLVKGKYHYMPDIPSSMDYIPNIKAEGEGDISIIKPVRYSDVRTAKILLRKQVGGNAYIKTYTVTPPNHSTVLINNDFDRGIQPNNGTNFGGGLLSQFSLYPEGGSASVEALQDNDKSGNSLILASSTSDTGQYPKINHDFQYMNGKIYCQMPSAAATPMLIMEANVSTEEINIKRGLFVLKDNMGNSSALAMIDTDAVFKRCNSSLEAIAGSSMGVCNTGQWYHLMAVLNLANKTYDFYVDGEKKLTNQTVEGLSGNQIMYLRFEHVDRFRTPGKTQSAGGKTYIDDIKVYTANQTEALRVYSPQDLSEYSPGSQQLMLEFNNPLNKSTVTASSISIRKQSDNSLAAFSVRAVSDRRVILEFSPQNNIIYNVYLSESIKDAWGSGFSGGRLITVNCRSVPPVVTITGIQEGMRVLPGEGINLSAAVSEGNNNISSVHFYAGDMYLGRGYLKNGEYTYYWYGIPKGTFNIRAEAFNNNGVSGVSPPVRVYVTASSEPMPGVYVNNNYDDGTINSLPQMSQFLAYNIGENAVAEVKDSPSGSKPGKALVISTMASSTYKNPNFLYDFKEKSGIIYADAVPVLVMETAVRIENKSIRRYLFGLRDEADRFVNLAAIDGGQFTLVGAGGSIITGSSFGICEENKWYHLLAKVSLATGTYDFYIDGVRVLTQKPLANSTGSFGTGLKSIRMDHSDNQYSKAVGGKTYYDDFKVYTSDAAVAPVAIPATELMNMSYLNTVIDLKFNTSIKKTALNTTGITVTKADDGTPISYTAEITDALYYRMRFAPNAFESNTAYRINFSTEVTDFFGNSMGEGYALNVYANNAVSICGEINRYHAGDICINNKSELTAGNLLSADGVVYNLSGAEQQVYMIIAVYQGSQLLAQGMAKEKLLSYEAQKNVTVEVNLPLGFTKNCTIKSFLWAGDGMKPISSAVALP